MLLKLIVRCLYNVYLRDDFVSKVKIQVTKTSGENTNATVNHGFAWTEENLVSESWLFLQLCVVFFLIN